jgi:hypothetical protein
MVGSIEQYDPVADTWSTCGWTLSTPRSQIAAHAVLAPPSATSSSSNPMTLYVLGMTRILPHPCYSIIVYYMMMTVI